MWRRKAFFVFGFLVGILGCDRRSPAPPSPASEPQRVTLAAVGDLLLHQDVQRAAEHAGSYRALWAPVAERLASADLTLGNLETPIAPTSGVPGRPFVFNAPAHLAQDLKTSGFQVVVTANNHACDQGAAGVLETLHHLSRAGLLALGSGSTREQAEGPLILERRGVRWALFARTERLNLGGFGAKSRAHVALLDLDRTRRAIAAVRPHVDVVVVSLHWGDEYATVPAKRQIAMAEALVAAGADLILGHHPHVLQPLRWVSAGGRTGAVAFSLGNFISNQDRTYRPNRDDPALGDNRDGALVWATFRKDPDARVRLERVELVPLWTINQRLDRGPGQPPVPFIRVTFLEHEGDVRAIRRQRLATILEGRWCLD